MSLKEWKNNELNMLLMKKWGLLKEDKSKELEHPPEGPGDKGYEEMIARQKGAEELEEGHVHGPECGCPDMEEGMEYRDDDEPEAGLRGQVRSTGDEHYQFDQDEREGKLEEDTEGEETYDYGEAEGHDKKELHDLIKRHATKSHIDALKRDMTYDEDHERRGERGTHFGESQEEIEEASKPAPGGPEARHVRRDNPDTYVGPAIVDPDDEPPAPGKRIKNPKHLSRTTTKVKPVRVKEGSRPISVREAKEITRAILERLRNKGGK